MLRTVFDGLLAGRSEAQIEAEILGVDSKREIVSDFELQQGTDSWRETKSALRIRTSLDTAPRCRICKARLVMDDASDDHIERRVDGGTSKVENAQLTHRYCNHGFKEHFAQRGLPLPEVNFPA